MSVRAEKLATGWAEDCDKIILRRCPVCKQDSIVGHGAAASRRTMSITTGSGSAGAAARLRNDLHFSSAVFSSLHPFSLLARCQALLAALCGALFVGEGGAQAEGR